MEQNQYPAPDSQMGCHFVACLDNEGGLEDLFFNTCNLTWGCRHTGCQEAVGPHGAYNDAGSYDIQLGSEVKMIDVGTPEALAFLKGFNKGEYTDLNQALELAKKLGFVIEEVFPL